MAGVTHRVTRMASVLRSIRAGKIAALSISTRNRPEPRVGDVLDIVAADSTQAVRSVITRIEPGEGFMSEVFFELTP